MNCGRATGFAVHQRLLEPHEQLGAFLHDGQVGGEVGVEHARRSPAGAGRRPSCRSPACRADSRSTRPAPRGWPARSARPRAWSDRRAPSQTSSIWSRSVMAPTGQTAAHWPHCTQTDVVEVLRRRPGRSRVSKPRSWGNRPPTCWISLHTVTQRRHLMHLPVSRTSAGVLSSIIVAGLLARVAKLADAQVERQRLQARSRRCGRRSGNRRRAPRAAARPPSGGRRAPAAVGLDLHALRDRHGAGGDQGRGPFHLHQADAAGADGLDFLEVTEGRDLDAGLAGRLEDRGALRAPRP